MCFSQMTGIVLRIKLIADYKADQTTLCKICIFSLRTNIITHFATSMNGMHIMYQSINQSINQSNLFHTA
jgi:hypothetical protein